MSQPASSSSPILSLALHRDSLGASWREAGQLRRNSAPVQEPIRALAEVQGLLQIEDNARPGAMAPRPSLETATLESTSTGVRVCLSSWEDVDS